MEKRRSRGEGGSGEERSREGGGREVGREGGEVEGMKERE